MGEGELIFVLCMVPPFFGVGTQGLNPENVMIEYNEQKKSMGKIKIIDWQIICPS